MSVYLLPISDSGEPYITHCNAHSVKHALEKFLNEFKEVYPWLEEDDWEEALNKLDERNIVVGDIYDLEEFTC